MSKLTCWILVAAATVFYASASVLAYGVILAVVESSGLSGAYLYALWGVVASLMFMFWCIAVAAVMP